MQHLIEVGFSDNEMVIITQLASHWEMGLADVVHELTREGLEKVQKIIVKEPAWSSYD